MSTSRGLCPTQTFVDWKLALRVDKLLERAPEDGPSSLRRLVRIATRVKPVGTYASSERQVAWIESSAHRPLESLWAGPGGGSPLTDLVSSVSFARRRM
jgi:hypothetical protein